MTALGNTTDMPVDISVVVPVYNSSDCLEELLKRLTIQLESMGKSYEIILVEDCSSDESWQVIEGLAPQYPNLKAFRLMRNCGQPKATLCGLLHAVGEIVITMDDDLQHPPDQIPLLLQALEDNPRLDCVFGVFRQKKHARYRNLGSRALQWVNNRAFGLSGHFRSSTFRSMRGSLARTIASHQTENPAILALILASTGSVQNVEVEHAERFAGRSNYTLASQFNAAFDNICNVSMMPLRLVSYTGVGLCALSLLMVLSVLIGKLAGSIGVAGWTTVVILISFFCGVILLSLGIMGEYLARILREVQGRPQYVVRQSLVGGRTAGTGQAKR
jgi:polyisoprenyl-phosphate glycosyltransferase